MNAKEKAAIEELKRAERIAKVRGAAQRLATHQDFLTVFEHLQSLYPITRSSFAQGHESNTHLAAIRDGEKNVMREILKLISLPQDADFEDAQTTLRPKAAVSELTPTPTP